MLTHSAELKSRFLVWALIYIQTLCMGASKALMSPQGAFAALWYDKSKGHIPKRTVPIPDRRQ